MYRPKTGSVDRATVVSDAKPLLTFGLTGARFKGDTGTSLDPLREWHRDKPAELLVKCLDRNTTLSGSSWTYTPSVVTGVVCRNCAWMSFAVPTFWNHVAHVLRNARKLTEVAGSTHCLPFGQSLGFFCMIPARTAAGQMWRRRKFLVLIGRPLAAG